MSSRAHSIPRSEKEETSHEEEFNKYLPVFENYQKARLSFAQGVAELACDPDIVPDVVQAGAIPILCPLIVDEVPNVKNTALFAIGKLADQSKTAAEDIMKRNIISVLVDTLRGDSRKSGNDGPSELKLYKKLAIYIFMAISKHDSQLAKQILEVRPLGIIKACLTDTDPQIKEDAAMTVANIAQHSRDLANSVVFEEEGLIQALISGLSDSEVLVIRATVSAIYEIIKHSEQLAYELVELDVVPVLTDLLSEPDEQLKRLILPTLTRFGSEVEGMEDISSREREILEFSIRGVTSDDYINSKNAVIHLLETTKDSEMAISAIREGALEAIFKYMQKHENLDLLPAITFINNVAIMDEDTASLIIEEEELLSKLSCILDSESPLEVRAECASAIGNLGSHSTALANEIGKAKLLILLSSLSEKPDIPLDLKTKCKKSLKGVLKQCTHLPTLEALLSEAGSDILDIILSQFTVILHGDGEARKQFVANGTLKKLLEIKPDPGSISEKAMNIIQKCFPADVIKMNSSSYLEELLAKVEEFKPAPERRSPGRRKVRGRVARAKKKPPIPVPSESESSKS